MCCAFCGVEEERDLGYEGTYDVQDIDWMTKVSLGLLAGVILDFGFGVQSKFR